MNKKKAGSEGVDKRKYSLSMILYEIGHRREKLNVNRPETDKIMTKSLVQKYPHELNIKQRR